MAQYIDKADVTAEIDRVLNSYDPNEITSGRYALAKLRSFLDTLDVKEVQEEHVNDDLGDELTTTVVRGCFTVFILFVSLFITVVVGQIIRSCSSEDKAAEHTEAVVAYETYDNGLPMLYDCIAARGSYKGVNIPRIAITSEKTNKTEWLNREDSKGEENLPYRDRVIYE